MKLGKLVELVEDGVGEKLKKLETDDTVDFTVLVTGEKTVLIADGMGAGTATVLRSILEESKIGKVVAIYYPPKNVLLLIKALN